MECNLTLKPSRLEKANALLKITFGWCLHLFLTGSNETLTQDHLDNVPSDVSSECLVHELESEWDNEQEKAKDRGTRPSLRRSIFHAFFPQLLWFNVLGVFMEMVTLCQPILFSMFVYLFEHGETPTAGTSLLHLAFLATSIMVPDVIREPFVFYNRLFGRKIQVACRSLIYKKILKLSNSTILKNSALVDETEKFNKISTVFPYLWLAPINCIVSIFILIYYVGLSWGYTLLGFGIVLIIFLPLQTLQRKMHIIYRERAARIRKYRLSILSEAFTSMRVIKMSVLERSFSEIIKKIRESELSAVLLSAIFKFIAMVITFFGHRLLEVVHLTIYFVTAERYMISHVFVIFSLSYIIRPTVLEYFPKAIYLYNECILGCDKIEEFMLLDDKEHLSEDSTRYSYSKESKEEPRIVVNELGCKWENSDDFALENVAIDICSGDILGVVGASGSGKTAFLMALLQEIPIITGNIKIQGTIAYVSQKPSIFPGTIRQNILFGKQYDECRYFKVIETVLLTKFINSLPEKDLSMTSKLRLAIDQEAKINLARALYKDADIYLLDDPFTYMDSTTSRYIFENGIMGYLKKKTRIMTTSRPSFMREVDRILVLKQGKVEIIGGYYDVRIIQSFISSFSDIDTVYSNAESEEEADSTPHVKYSGMANIQIDANENTSLIDSKSVESEQKINNKHYADYFCAGSNNYGLTVLVICILITQVMYFMADFWIAHWANLEQCYRHHFNDTTCNEFRFLDPFDYVELNNADSTLVFIIFIGACSFTTILYGVLFFLITLNACKRLHETVFNQVIQTAMLFFNSTPLDCILRRFNEDMRTMEDELPTTMLGSIQVMVLTCGIVVVNMIMSWYLLFIAVPLFALILYVRNKTAKPRIEIQNLEEMLKLPVDEHVDKAIRGLTTIRSHQARDAFLESFYDAQDSLNEAWIANQASQRLLSVSYYCIVQVFIVCILFASLIGKSGLSVGLVGIVVGRVLLLSQLIQKSVFGINDTEKLMKSVIRVTDYTHLFPEAPRFNKYTKPPASWPEEGNITFSNVFLSYSAESPIVLKNMSFNIEHREKIGVLGRRGAGKSSIATALFRLAEPTGNILIDGVSISALGLYNLRKKISIVPKDPVLFSTSLRVNIDPFGEYNDFALWEALKRVRLDWFVRECMGKLDMTVGDGGNQFSVGQRQLIYLARAILRRNKILIVEEPIKSDDQIITSLIQTTIRSHFKYCTVFTITNRLNNIMDSDRVMVIDDGELVEFDTAYTLLQNRSSLVRKLLKESNTFERKRLLGIATAFHAERR
ncbi:ATP-binding cassette sub-family C member 4-like [Antedon mediterranea]|uniref:ATP-binding cassette sub-family C member 4-like n=1 Tax=Antedon mediterranea TaxID=105859 RepID=UPI003AF9FF8F